MARTQSAPLSRLFGSASERQKKPYSLYYRHLVFCFAITAALLLIVLWAQGRTRASILEANESYYEAQLTQTGQIIDAYLENYQKIASMFSSAPLIRYYMGQITANHSMYVVGAQWIQREILRFQTKSMFDNIYVYMPDMPIVNAFFYEALDTVSPDMQGLMDEFSKNPQLSQSRYVVTGISPYQLSIINPICAKGRFLGMMRLDLQMNILTKLMAKVELGESAHLLIVDGDRILYSSNPDEILTASDTSGDLESAMSHSIHSTGWKFIGVLPQDMIRKELAKSTYTFILVICGAMLMVAVFSLLTFHTMMAPVHEITRLLRRVGEGDFETELPNSRVKEYAIFVNSFNSMVKKVKSLLEKLYYQQVYLRKAQIGEMQSKFNPHFLYNTLDMIYWQLVKKGDDETMEMVIALSEILRYSITANHEFGTIYEEQRQIENYLLLQGKRLGENFEWEINFDDDILAYKVPCLLLQPLVENAINHAFKLRGTAYCYVGITGAREGDILVLSVVDNGIGMSPEKVSEIMNGNPAPGNGGSKLGINLVHKRLQYIYGDEYGITIETELGKGCCVRITLSASEDAEIYMMPPGERSPYASGKA